MLIILITTIFIFLIGYVIIQLFGFLKGRSLIEKFSYAWGLGVGCIGIQLFIYSVLHISWSRVSLLAPWIILALIFLKNSFSIKSFKTIVKSVLLNSILTKRIIFLRYSNNEKLLVLFFGSLILLLILFVGFESILRPIQAWDGWVNWVFRPKVFFLANNIDMNYVRYTYNDYPLIISLLGTFGYIMMGQIHDTYVLFLFFVFYVSLAGVFFTFCRRMLSLNMALILTFLLLSTQNLIRHGGRYEVGQADLALGYFIFATTCLLAEFLMTQDKKILIFLSFLLGITAQIKEDGIPFFLIVNLILLFVIHKWKKYLYLLSMSPAVLIMSTWTLYKMFNNYPTSLLFREQIHIHVDKVAAIVLTMIKECLNFQNWNLLWIVFIYSIIFSWRKLSKLKLFILIFCLQLLSYFAVYMITPGDAVYRVEGTIDRLYIHLAPLAILMIGLLLQKELIYIEKMFINNGKNLRTYAQKFKKN